MSWSIKNLALSLWLSFLRGLALIFILIGVALFIFGYSMEGNLRSVLYAMGSSVLASGVFAAMLKSLQFIGIFKDEINLIFSNEHNITLVKSFLSESLVKALFDHQQKDLLVDIYGIKADFFSTKIEISNLEGQGKVTREMQGIKTTGGFQIQYIPGKESFSTPDAKITSKPSDYFQIVGDFTRKMVSLNIERITESECFYRIKIDGNLTDRDPVLSYCYNYNISKPFLMTKEETDYHYGTHEFKNEYYAVDTVYPIEGRLILEIAFPEGYKPKLYPGVFLGRFEFQHEKELARVKNGFEETSRGAKFTVEKPQIGFRYFIHWEPLPQKKVDRLRPSKSD